MPSTRRFLLLIRIIYFCLAPRGLAVRGSERDRLHQGLGSLSPRGRGERTCGDRDRAELAPLAGAPARPGPAAAARSRPGDGGPTRDSEMPGSQQPGRAQRDRPPGGTWDGEAAAAAPLPAAP